MKRRSKSKANLRTYGRTVLVVPKRKAARRRDEIMLEFTAEQLQALDDFGKASIAGGSAERVLRDTLSMARFERNLRKLPNPFDAA